MSEFGNYFSNLSSQIKQVAGQVIDTVVEQARDNGIASAGGGANPHSAAPATAQYTQQNKVYTIFIKMTSF